MILCILLLLVLLLYHLLHSLHVLIHQLRLSYRIVLNKESIQPNCLIWIRDTRFFHLLDFSLSHFDGVENFKNSIKIFGVSSKVGFNCFLILNKCKIQLEFIFSSVSSHLSIIRNCLPISQPISTLRKLIKHQKCIISQPYHSTLTS